MEYRLGNYRRIKSNGDTVTLTCPKCNHKVNMGVFSNAETRLTAELPFVTKGDVFFLVCPECAGVFGVDETKGKNFTKGEKLAIGNFDLKELKHFDI